MYFLTLIITYDESAISTGLTFATAVNSYVSNVRRTEYAKFWKVVTFNLYFDFGVSPNNGATIFNINDSKLFPRIVTEFPLVGVLAGNTYKTYLNPNGKVEFNSTETISSDKYIFCSIAGTYICVDA